MTDTSKSQLSITVSDSPCIRAIREAIRRDRCETRSRPGEYGARLLADILPKPLTILPKHLNLPPKGSNCIRLAFSLSFRRPTRFQFHQRGVQTRLNLTHTPNTRSNAKRTAQGERGGCIYNSQRGQGGGGNRQLYLNPADQRLAPRHRRHRHVITSPITQRHDAAPTSTWSRR